MSKVLLIPLFLFGLASIAGAQSGTWTLLPDSPSGAQNGRHEDMSFPTPERGYVVNFSGEFYRTMDGGETWKLVHSVSTFQEQPVRFRSVGFANEDKGWIGALTPGSVLWQTDDGGETLRNLTPRLGTLTEGGICGLWVVNENVVYGVGRYYGPPYLYMTKDGGLTWKVVNMNGYAGRLIDVFFFDELNGFVVGGSTEIGGTSRAVVLRTRDGGATWEVKYVSQNDGEWGWKISFPSPSVGYVSVERFPIGAARVLKTIDGGETWSEGTIPGSRPLQGIGFITQWHGWASGRGVTSETRDGGVTWTSDESDLDQVINRFRMFGDTLGYAVGDRVYKYVGKSQVDTETTEAPLAKNLLRQNFPNPFYPLTTFEYEILEEGQVEIAIYDLLGRLVKPLVNRRLIPGAHRSTWDGADATGKRVGPGFYLYSLKTGAYVETRRMVLLGTP